MEEKNVFYTSEPPLGFITLNRPHRLNAIGGSLIPDFLEALEAARRDQQALVVILRGAGRAFCAGADVRERAEMKPVEWRGEAIQDVTRSIVRLGKPIIAAVQGYALGGGCEFAMNCDIRIAAEDARFGFPETGVGAAVTCAGTQTLPRLIGLGRAKEMILTGDMVEAGQAERWGLVNKVVPLAELDKAAREVALKIAEHSPQAVRMMRTALDRGAELSMEGALELEMGYSYALSVSGETQRRMGEKARRIGRAGKEGKQ